MSEKCLGDLTDSKGLFWYIGFILVCWFIFKLVRSLWRGLYTCFLANLFGAGVNWKKLGQWAAVTGATDGIGKAYANALAAKGFDIILISRTFEKLQDVASAISKKYNVKTKVIAVDFTKDVDIYDEIRSEIQGLEIGVLVNNIGMSYPYAEYLTKVPNAEKFSDDLVKANITSCARMTLLVLPQMEVRRKGVIINVSSLSAQSPMPLLSLYSAAKIFVNFFSKATQEEYKNKGIIVQSVLPGFVSTNMSKMRPSLTTCTPEVFVKWALKTVGVEGQTYGYPVHKIQGYGQEILSSYFPETLNLAINHKMLNTIRVRYYKKYGLVDSEKKSSSRKEK